MKFTRPTSSIFVPDGLSSWEALARTTHLAIVAHQDDAEILAIDGILTCFQQKDLWFANVVVTDGRGSPRKGSYQAYTDDEMGAVRNREQKKAAFLGEFAAQVFLEYPSSAVKDGTNDQPVEDIMHLIKGAQPEVVYTHNLADKHDTHVAVSLKVIEALRRLPASQRPKKLYGGEVWRDLDWLMDTDKVAFNCSAHQNLQAALVGLYDSQISGGKRYDLATMSRRSAHATYSESHETDSVTGLSYAIDLTPLIENVTLDVADFVKSFVNRFAQDVDQRIHQLQKMTR